MQDCSGTRSQQWLLRNMDSGGLKTISLSHESVYTYVFPLFQLENINFVELKILKLLYSKTVVYNSFVGMFAYFPTKICI